MPDMDAIRIEQENGADHGRGLQFDEAQEGFQGLRHWFAAGDHFEHFHLGAGQRLGLFAAGEVHIHADETRFLRIGLDLEEGREHDAMIAVLVAEGKLDGSNRLAIPFNFGDGLLKFNRLPPGEDQVIQRFAEGFRGQPAVDEFRGVIPINDASGAVEPLHGHVGGVFDGGAEAFLAFAQTEHGAVAFAEDDGGDQADEGGDGEVDLQ